MDSLETNPLAKMRAPKWSSLLYHKENTMEYKVVCERCETEFFVDIIGNKNYRTWKLRANSWHCKKCLEKDKEELNKKNQAANLEVGMPALEGSTKQIAWAETIRAIYYKKLSNRDEAFWNIKKIENLEERIYEFFRETRASWWIDNRDKGSIDLHNILSSIKTGENKIIAEQEAAIIEEAKVEAVVRPQTPVTETIAEISLEDKSRICVKFEEKNESFKTIVKDLGFRWGDGKWCREIKPTNGIPSDRIAELGNKLLSSGFIIRIFDEKMRNNAINAVFEAEHKKWIFGINSGKYEGWFSISLSFGDFYHEAKAIPSAKYDDRSIVVCKEQYEVVLDFAQKNDFKLSPLAQNIVETAIRDKELALIAEPIQKQKEEYKKEVANTIEPTLLDDEA